jgi:hypothetical protein
MSADLYRPHLLVDVNDAIQGTLEVSQREEWANMGQVLKMLTKEGLNSLEELMMDINL